jgi:hypothetical protein
MACALHFLNTSYKSRLTITGGENMFGNNKVKELENKILLLENELQRERQNNEIRRLDSLLDFFKKQVTPAREAHKDPIDFSIDDLPTSRTEEPKIDEVLISKEYAHKIDDLHNIDFSTKEDLSRLYNKIYDLVKKDLKPTIESNPEKTLAILLSHFDKTINSGS